MSAHTPGPWALSRNTEFLYPGRAGRVRDVQWESGDNGGVVARVCMWDKSGDRDEAEANARLIAAAPEQHDALYNAIGLFGSLCTDETQRLWLEQARAAIAKATGDAA